MMQMILIRGTPAEESLKTLEAFASKPENWYRPLQHAVPGDQEDFTRIVQAIDLSSGKELTYRVVFTNTVGIDTRGAEHLFKHASISLGDRTEYPGPLATFTICKFLGFQGSVEDWMIDTHPDEEGVLVIIQEMSDPRGKKQDNTNQEGNKHEDQNAEVSQH